MSVHKATGNVNPSIYGKPDVKQTLEEFKAVFMSAVGATFYQAIQTTSLTAGKHLKGTIRPRKMERPKMDT